MRVRVCVRYLRATLQIVNSNRTEWFLLQEDRYFIAANLQRFQGIVCDHIVDCPQNKECAI